MAKYAFIVASNKRYIPGLTAVLNSLHKLGNKNDVVLLGYNLPESYTRKFYEYCFNIVYIPILQAEVDKYGEGEVLMRLRYEIPSRTQYDAVCILDADMMILSNVDRYLACADKAGLVLGCTLEQKRRYGDPNHQFPVGSGKYIIPVDFWNGRDLCCAPLFAGPKWYPALKRSWEIFAQEKREERFKAPDMDALNICLIEAGAYDYTIPLSQHTWTGLHECLMKAHTRAVEIHGIPFTEDGEEINIIHGQYWNIKWRGWQLDGQMGMIEREFDKSPSYISRSKGSFENILRWYKDIATGGPINVNDYLEYCDSHSPIQDVMEIT